jgi:hypothetical protein
MRANDRQASRSSSLDSLTDDTVDTYTIVRRLIDEARAEREALDRAAADDTRSR